MNAVILGLIVIAATTFGNEQVSPRRLVLLKDVKILDSTYIMNMGAPFSEYEFLAFKDQFKNQKLQRNLYGYLYDRSRRVFTPILIASLTAPAVQIRATKKQFTIETHETTLKGRLHGNQQISMTILTDSESHYGIQFEAQNPKGERQPLYSFTRLVLDQTTIEVAKIEEIDLSRIGQSEFHKWLAQKVWIKNQQVPDSVDAFVVVSFKGSIADLKLKNGKKSVGTLLFVKDGSEFVQSTGLGIEGDVGSILNLETRVIFWSGYDSYGHYKTLGYVLPRDFTRQGFVRANYTSTDGSSFTDRTYLILKPSFETKPVVSCYHLY